MIGLLRAAIEKIWEISTNLYFWGRIFLDLILEKTQKKADQMTLSSEIVSSPPENPFLNPFFETLSNDFASFLEDIKQYLSEACDAETLVLITDYQAKINPVYRPTFLQDPIYCYANLLFFAEQMQMALNNKNDQSHSQLNYFFEKLSESQETMAALDSMFVVIRAAETLLKKIRQFNTHKAPNKEYAYLLNTPALMDNINFNLSQLIATSDQTVNAVANFKHIANLQALNILFEEIYLHLEKLEIQYCLKAGYLTQLILPPSHLCLVNVMQKFADYFNKRNYPFMTQEEFPYYFARSAQLTALQKAMPQSEASYFFRIKILKERTQNLQDAQFALEIKKIAEEKQSQKDYLVNRNHNIQLILGSHLTTLKKEQKDQTKNKKITLLETLQCFLLEKNNTLEDALSKLKLIYADDFYLLWEGRTRMTMQALEKETQLPEDRLISTRLAIRDCEEALLIAKIAQQSSLEKRLSALYCLARLLRQHPNIRLRPILHQLGPEHYTTLQTHESALIQNIQAIDSNLPNSLMTSLTTHERPGALTASSNMTLALDLAIIDLKQQRSAPIGFFATLFRLEKNYKRALEADISKLEKKQRARASRSK